MTGNPVVWFEIYVQDMARARRFYETVLEVELARLESPGMEMWAFPSQKESYGACGSLVRMEGVPSGGNSVLVYFSCTDCAVEAGRVAAAGGRIEREKMSIGEYGFIVLAHDTDRNMFGLHSMQ
jgi:predicted enzyme related to lactoylglutathione lyase